jgi:hypothetical protein
MEIQMQVLSKVAVPDGAVTHVMAAEAFGDEVIVSYVLDTDEDEGNALQSLVIPKGLLSDLLLLLSKVEH